MRKLTFKQCVAILVVILAIAYYSIYVCGDIKIMFTRIFGFMIPLYLLFNALASYLVMRAFFTRQKKFLSYPFAVMVVAVGVSFLARYVEICGLYSVAVFVGSLAFGASIGILVNSMYVSVEDEVAKYEPATNFKSYIQYKGGEDMLVTIDNFPYDYSVLPVNRELQFYLDYTIRPQPRKCDIRHKGLYIRRLTRSVIELAKGQDVNYDMLYTATIFHDLGLDIRRDEYNTISALLVRNDRFVKEHFTPEQIEVIALAIEEHRDPIDAPLHSIYGKILKSAYIENNPENLDENIND